MKLLIDRWLSFTPFMDADKDATGGAKEQEPADTADDDTDLDDLDDDFDWGDDDEPEDDSDDDKDDKDDKKNDDNTDEDDENGDVQDDDTNAVFARARRITEAEADKKVQAALNQMNSFAKSKGFNSWEEMQAEESNKKFEEERGKILAESADDPVSAIQKLVDLTLQNHPMVKQIEMQRQAEEQRQAAEFMNKSVQALVKRFPDSGIKSLDDIYELDNGAEIIELWKRGIPLDDAFAVKNIGKITSQKSAAAKQSALNSINAKSHLKGTHQSAGSESSDIEIPRETYSTYKVMFPNWTPKQIKEHYAKVQKMTKG